ncbi:helix-turn-helix domain-containing protein [Massilia sp. 2TAF26]|uniref:AraC family transcriptional regulator n=1 Tax=Massilia sp. 2TAF26 TaxID=3233012 RepID=UPI003F9A136A
MLTTLDFDPDPRRVPSIAEPVTVNLRRPAPGLRVPKHRHAWAQIAYPFRGSIQVEAQEMMWIVPPLRAVWIPPDVEHEVTMLGEVELRTIYVAPEAAPRAIDACAVIEISALTRALFEALLAADPVNDGRRHLLTELLLVEVGRAPALSLGLRMPRDRRLQALCQALAADPASHRTLEDWAGQVGASARTLARLFREEMNFGFGTWRQQLRLERSIELMVRGLPLGEVAARMGYESQSAFSAMFRRALGVAPSRFIDDAAVSGPRA